MKKTLFEKHSFKTFNECTTLLYDAENWWFYSTLLANKTLSLRPATLSDMDKFEGHLRRADPEDYMVDKRGGVCCSQKSFRFKSL